MSGWRCAICNMPIYLVRGARPGVDPMEWVHWHDLTPGCALAAAGVPQEPTEGGES